MDSRKLEDLRARYGTGASGQSHHPEFRKVVEQIFAGTDRRPKPYEGVSTLLGAPMRLDALQLPDLGGLDVALIGVPMDLGVTNRAGARLGPRAVRAVERIGPYHHVHRLAPLMSVQSCRCRRCAVSQPLQPGGEPPGHRGLLRQDRCGRGGTAERGRRPFHHAPHLEGAGRRPAPGAGPHRCSLRHERSLRRLEVSSRRPVPQAVLAGVLDPERTIQIGIRGGAEYLWEFSYESGMTVIHAEEVMQLGIAKVIERAARQSWARAPRTSRSMSTASIRPLRRAPARRRSAD